MVVAPPNGTWYNIRVLIKTNQYVVENVQSVVGDYIEDTVGSSSRRQR